jgi:hypothetical protein
MSAEDDDTSSATDAASDATADAVGISLDWDILDGILEIGLGIKFLEIHLELGITLKLSD